jgi:hypothetical protein
MSNKDKYPRVTQVQVDLWLVDPVTQAYLTCLKTTEELIDKKLTSGQCFDFENNDFSMNQVSEAMGAKQMLSSMANFNDVLNVAEMVEVKNEQ